MAEISRRRFLVTAGAVAGVSVVRPQSLYGSSPSPLAQPDMPADYTLNIATKPIELAPKHIVSVTTYNGQFPGPLLRLKEGRRVTVDVHNDTDVPEQLHGMGRLFRQTQTVRQRKERHSSLLMEAAEFRSFQSTLAFASI
ncbi:multicopper oxidase domain-containing protein [Tunturiibacter gelidiferens]|uniref:multicopper oxidase domain-containing protein n=1 Tax=Tunturiibacter gelidiferens TaxID=3069689 RepID=UPI003D9B50C2